MISFGFGKVSTMQSMEKFFPREKSMGRYHSAFKKETKVVDQTNFKASQNYRTKKITYGLKKN